MSDFILLAAAMTDEGYRATHRASPASTIPRAVHCTDCGGYAPFRDDRMAARYECMVCGHAMAAMWADRGVAGTGALKPWFEG